MVATIATAFPGLVSLSSLHSVDVRDIFAYYRLAVRTLIDRTVVAALIAKMPMLTQEGQHETLKAAIKKSVLQADQADKEEEPEVQTKEQYLQRVAMLKAMSAQGGGFIKCR